MKVTEILDDCPLRTSDFRIPTRKNFCTNKTRVEMSAKRYVSPLREYPGSFKIFKRTGVPLKKDGVKKLNITLRSRTGQSRKREPKNTKSRNKKPPND